MDDEAARAPVDGTIGIAFGAPREASWLRISEIPTTLSIAGVSCLGICGTLRRIAAADSRTRCAAAEMPKAMPVDFLLRLALRVNSTFLEGRRLVSRDSA